MKKASLIVALAILAVGIIVGVIFFMAPRSQPTNIPASAAPASEQAVASTIQGGTLQDCDQYANTIIGGINYRTVCRNNVAMRMAMTKLDYTQCQNLDDKLVSISSCEQAVVREALAKNLDASYCASVGSDALKTYCQTTFVQDEVSRSGNNKLCDTLTGDLRSICVANAFTVVLNTNPKNIDCTIAPTGEGKDCLALRAELAKDITKRNCSNIQNRGLMQICETP